MTSVTGVLGQSINGSMRILKENLSQLKDFNYSQGPLFFVSSLSVDEVNLRRGTRYCFVNNYNPVLLKSWRPNIDLHPVTNYHEALAYMGVYCSNSEKDTSKALCQVEREIKTQKMITRVAMYEIALAFGMHAKLQFRKGHTYVYQSYG